MRNIPSVVKEKGKGHRHPEQDKMLETVLNNDEPLDRIGIQVPRSLKQQLMITVASNKELKDIRTAVTMAIVNLIQQYRD